MLARLFIFMVIGLAVYSPVTATVNVVVITYEGIVVAADSRVTLTNPSNNLIRIETDYGGWPTALLWETLIRATW